MSKYQSIRQMWSKIDISSVQELERALDSFRILFAFHSGRIENDEITFHDTREIFENGKVLNFSGNPRSLFEQQNQKLCYEYLKDRIASRDPLSIDLVKETHRILTSGTYDEKRFIANGERPGEFKRHDYVTGIHEVGYQPDEVEGAIRELLDELNNYSADNSLKAAAYFHVSFENIHPFADGNGRAGRTLLNYYLLTHGEPPVIIYDEDKKEYYSALEKYDTEEEIEPMVDFLIKETVKTWEARLEREIKAGRFLPHCQ